MSGSSISKWHRPLHRRLRFSAILVALLLAIAASLLGSAGSASAAAAPNLIATPKGPGVITFSLAGYSASYIDVGFGVDVSHFVYTTVNNGSSKDVKSDQCVTKYQAYDAAGAKAGPEGSVRNPANCVSSSPTITVTPTPTITVTPTSVSSGPTGGKTTSPGGSSSSASTSASCNNNPQWGSDVKDTEDKTTLTYTSAYIGKLPLCEGIAIPASYNGYYTHGPTWPTSGDQQWKFWEAGSLTREHPVVVHTLPSNFSTECFFQVDPNHSNHAYDGKDGALPHYNDVFTPVNTVMAVNGGTKLCIEDHTSSSPAPSGSESESSSAPATSSAPASSSAGHTTVPASSPVVVSPSASMSIGTPMSTSRTLTPGHVIVINTGGLEAGGHTVQLQFTIFSHSGSLLVADSAAPALLSHSGGGGLIGVVATMILLFIVLGVLGFYYRRPIACKLGMGEFRGIGDSERRH